MIEMLTDPVFWFLGVAMGIGYLLGYMQGRPPREGSGS